MKTTNNFKSQFLLDPKITFLNFGSFGACPKPIFENYLNWQYLLESEPVQFIAVNGAAHMKTSREALAKFINCNADDIVYTPNPSFAVNIIAKNLKLKEGDEILSTNIEYGATERTWNYYCKIQGAHFVKAQIQLPVQSKEELLEQFWKSYSSKTKVVFLSHITSSTGLVLPVKEICERAKELGLITIVDGAHAPGHVKLDLKELKADFYTGACHKWMMTPKGSSFLFVKKEYQKDLDPLIISWGYESDSPSGSQFIDYHQFNGTRDFSAYLTIPKAIEFMEEYKWTEVSEMCKKIVLDNAPRFCELMETEPLAPLNNEFFGQMFSIPIGTSNPEELYKTLFSKYQIEIPVARGNGKFYLRYSINAFNSQKDLDHLFEAMKELKSQTELLSKP
jgi:isopenicillin-N epimerase